MFSLTHTRTRFHDGVIIESEPFIDYDPEGEPVYIEAVQRDGKTARTRRRRRRRPQPLADFAVGVSGLRWAEAWLEARKEAGLDAAKDGVLLPAPLRRGCFSSIR